MPAAAIFALAGTGSGLIGYLVVIVLVFVHLVAALQAETYEERGLEESGAMKLPHQQQPEGAGARSPTSRSG